MVAFLPMQLSAQTDGHTLPAAQKAGAVVVPGGKISLHANGGLSLTPVLSNCDFTATPTWADGETPWFTLTERKPGSWKINADFWYKTEPRTGIVTITLSDGTTEEITVEQRGNNAVSTIRGDRQVSVTSATASEQNSSSEGIAKTYDDNYGSYYHSKWKGGSTSFPVTLTYRFDGAHIDYLTYIPRTDSDNGCFGVVTIEYATKDAPTTFRTVKADHDFGFTSTPASVNLGKQGLDNVSSIRFTVKSGKNNFVTCAEMEFYAKDRSAEEAFSSLFTDALCSQLKPGITQADIDRCPQPYARQLASYLMHEDYSREFRVASFDCYEPRTTLQQRLKTSSYYDAYENPTGIYFERGEQIAIFADGIDEDHPVSLCIKCFSNAKAITAEGQPESYYSLSNGINIITAENRGNGYVSYYSNDYANAPTIRLHFAMAAETGYFDAARHNGEDWVRLLSAAKSDIFDVITQRLHVAAPTATLRLKCPTNGEKLAAIYDQVIYREREIMGMQRYNCEPRNHQFARPVKSGMFADGIGAAAAFDYFGDWVNPDNFGFWGFAHELGHINQISPGFKWSGCGETTNNIYSAWVAHTVGSTEAYGRGYHNLEDEVTGIKEYAGLRGGRFQAYLDEGVRLGKSWQLQEGPDYYGTVPSQKTVTGQDADGHNTGSVTTPTRNYDHFVKVVPFWQLTLWTEECGGCPGAFGTLINSYREDFDAQRCNTNGKQQVEMMKRFCDAAQADLCDFFEKAGLLRPINAYIEDYGPGWNIITQEMCDEVRSYVAAKGYPAAPAALHYINAYNYPRFRDKVALKDAGVNIGCSALGSRVQVDNKVWAGAVGYETYNADGELLRITMFGLGDSQMSDRYTQVLFPTGEGASYIMAVGYDGTRVKCYQK